MAGSRPREETLRLQFGTAANTIGAHLYAIEKLNDGNPEVHHHDGKPRVIAFEAKGRVHKKVSATQAIQRERPQHDVPNAWGGEVQVFEQAPFDPTPSPSFPPSSAYWSWEDFSDKNLFEVEEFRPYMPLHNVFEGQARSCEGVLSSSTIESMEDHLRGVLEETDNLRCVENFVDMDSSWAGLSLEVLAYLSEECPSTVVATFGNDWNYPLADQTDANVYSAGIRSRDRSKIGARRGINLLASVAMLIESSSVFIPVALSRSSRRYATKTPGHELVAAATFAASTIEIAVSEFRASPSGSVYRLIEGILPSMKVLELSARFPFVENPATLIDDATSMSAMESSSWNQSSLLPRYTTPRSHWSSVATLTPPARFRRVHFRGEFERYATSLQSTMSQIADGNTVATWTREPLLLESPTALNAVDAASQLSLSHAVGGFLHEVATQSSRSDRRVLYEFTQAGMNVDAVEEYQASLRAMCDAYPVQQKPSCDLSDDVDEMDDETST